MKTVLKQQAINLPSVIGILCPTCGADDWALASKAVQPKDESKVKLRCSACEAARVKPDKLLSEAGFQRRANRYYERQALSLDLKIGKALDFLYQYNFIKVAPSSALVLVDCFDTLIGTREEDDVFDEGAHPRVDAVVALINAITEVADFDSWGSQPMRDEEDVEAIMDFRGSKPRHITLLDIRDSLRVTVALKGGV